MGKTWSGPDRKKFGKRKTKRHRSRSKWSSKNGGRGTAPRLRTLAIDVAEFRLHGGELKTPRVLLPTPLPPPPKVRQVPMVRLSPIPSDKELNGIGESRKTLYDSLTTAELMDRILFYTRQCRSLTAMARGAQNAGDLPSAEKIRAEKHDFFLPEMNAIRLYLERFR